MTIRWHLVHQDEILRSTTAPDIHAARTALGWRNGQASYVTSDASWREGMVKPLAKRRCVSCGARERQRGSYCYPCDNRRNAENKRRTLAASAEASERNAERQREKRRGVKILAVARA